MDKVNIGKIINTHGIKGEVKVYSNTHFVEKRFQIGNHLFIQFQNQEEEVIITSFRMHKGMVLLTFKGKDNINLVEKYKQSDVFAFKEYEYLEDGEYYYSDIIGCEVIDEFHGNIGRITSILETQAHDILLIETKYGEVKIPYVDAFVMKEDIENKTFYIKMIKGMYHEN